MLITGDPGRVNESQVARAQLVVTIAESLSLRRFKAMLGKALHAALFWPTGFRSVFVVECNGNALELARQITSQCSKAVGHVTPVLARTESDIEPIRKSAVGVALNHIGEAESFCFRLNKRGRHSLQQHTTEIERSIGGSIAEALEKKHSRKAAVDLDDPQITIVAEVLGPVTSIGISRKSWRSGPVPGAAC
jgi:tRNA(Ser,Leu) C12 N-acetylase TAN1